MPEIGYRDYKTTRAAQSGAAGTRRAQRSSGSGRSLCLCHPFEHQRFVGVRIVNADGDFAGQQFFDQPAHHFGPPTLAQDRNVISRLTVASS